METQSYATLPTVNHAWSHASRASASYITVTYASSPVPQSMQGLRTSAQSAGHAFEQKASAPCKLMSLSTARSHINSWVSLSSCQTATAGPQIICHLVRQRNDTSSNSIKHVAMLDIRQRTQQLAPGTLACICKSILQVVNLPLLPVCLIACCWRRQAAVLSSHTKQ